MRLYHGSMEVVRKPEFGKGKVTNDYGRGFYCTCHVELAQEWACGDGVDGYANAYDFSLDELNILNLHADGYSILHWLALLLANRQIAPSTPLMKRGMEWLKEHFFVDVERYDMIVGYRADDSYYSFAKAFMRNEISVECLALAMHLGDLGLQYVLKSPRAFQRLRFLEAIPAKHEQFFPRRRQRDEDAQRKFREEAETEDLQGVFLRDLIREEVKLDDPRLQSVLFG